MIRRRRRRRRIIGHAMRCPAAEAEWSACDDAAPRTPRAKRVGAGGISSIIIIARCNSHATVAVLCSTHTDPLPADSIACRSYRETRRFVAPLSLAHLSNSTGILTIFISPQTLFITTNLNERISAYMNVPTFTTLQTRSFLISWTVREASYTR